MNYKIKNTNNNELRELETRIDKMLTKSFKVVVWKLFL